MEKKVATKNTNTSTQDKIMDVWLKINVAINDELEKLKVLDAEREEIKNNLNKLPEAKLKMQMAESVKKYEKVLANLKALRAQAEQLKNTIKQRK